MRLWTPHETPSMLCGSSWSAAAVAAEAPQQRMRWSGGEAAAAAAPGDNQRRQREQQLQPAHGITSLEKRGPLTQICRMPPLKAAAPPATLPEDDQDSDASEEMSDPEDDIVEDEAEFECVRDAARDRVAPRTRDKYDLFIGLMKAFFVSQRDLQCEVVENQCKLPLSITAVGRYLGHVEAKTREYSPGKFKPVSPSYYRAVVQSIHDLYICNQQGVDESLRLLMFSRQKTYIRRIAQMKATGTYPIAPSRCISGEGYKLLCESLAKAEPAEEGGWAWHLVSCIWSYVVLLWCLLARCDRVAQLRWADFSWTGDALTVFIQKSKSDQAGDRAYHKKLYTSNTPATCPVLALSVLFFSREMSQRSEFIFPRADTRRAGLRQLSRLVRLFFPESQFASFGCNPHEIAWHHFKRGGMTFLSSKMDGPSHVAVKMRADQTVMDVSRFYIMQSTGQDGYIGRLLSMLPYGDPPFAKQEYSLPTTTQIQWTSLVADYSELPVAFRYEVLPKLLASICKHQTWLRDMLPRGHPLLVSELFTVHDSLLLGALPHVHEMTRPMGECTGLPLSLQTHLLLRQHLHPLPAPQQPLPAPVYLGDAAVSNRGDLSMRALRPLPKNYHLTKLSIVALWRAWWCDTHTEPMPLRMMEGKFPKNSDYAADRTRYTRYKTVVKFIQSGLTANACVEQTALAFSRGWRSLATHLKIHHGIDCDPESAPSTLYGHLTSLQAFTPPEVRSLHTHVGHASPRPLDEVLRDHMETLQNSEATGAAAVIHRDLQASLNKDQRFGYLQTHEHWPQPSNGWIVGAVQCAKCVSCDKYWATDKSIRAHLLQHMTAAQREVHFRAHNAGTWVYTAPSTKWCVAVTPPGNAHSKYVPVQFQAAQHRKQSVHAPPAQPVASSPAQLLLPVQAAVASSERPAAVQLLPPPGDERLKCCCGETFQNISTLRKHHNGIGGKRPRDPIHPCTAGCAL